MQEKTEQQSIASDGVLLSMVSGGRACVLRFLFFRLSKYMA